jgi:hypothetical protein
MRELWSENLSGFINDVTRRYRSERAQAETDDR